MEQNLDKELITFSFGKNWRDFVETVSEDSIRRAMGDIEEWLGADRVAGKRVLDVGSGSGIHSLCYYLMGAREVLSFDVDPYSVDSTRLLWQKAGSPPNWRVTQGSALDKEFVGGLGRYEVVYSWGVLHHTGRMWEAVGNAASLVAPGGLFWISLYAKGPCYPIHLELKKSYNRASYLGRKRMIWTKIYELMRRRWAEGKNPLTWNEKQMRGMDTYHDILDWLGGLPYEVAAVEEVVGFCRDRGFVPERVDERPEGGCSVYLFSLPERAPAP